MALSLAVGVEVPDPLGLSMLKRPCMPAGRVFDVAPLVGSAWSEAILAHRDAELKGGVKTVFLLPLT